MNLSSILGVVIGVGLTALLGRAFYINYMMSKGRRVTTQSIQQGLGREVTMRERSSRRVARSSRAGGDYFDVESGLREPPPVHLSRDYEEPLPIYELPPEYSAIAKPGQRRIEIPLDGPIPYDQLYRRDTVASSSSASSSASSSRHSAERIPDEPPVYTVTVR